jgi:hypothetical protein
MAHWKATIHIYSHKRFKKNPQINFIYNTMPKNTKWHSGGLGLLWINLTIRGYEVIFFYQSY